ncbi:unnamed protein product, partial [Porites evermanni]
MSFKEFCDLLVLLYGDEIISDEEFLLLYDSFMSKNPDFPHENYQRFDLDSMNSAECKAEFQGRKHDAGILNDSGLLRDFQQYAYNPAAQAMCIYGDLAYPLRVHLQTPFR